MAKRSPILGYNHNVRHRGLIFHVQTEDSGMKSPHLFTHLFHGGVIISSRKLVYDNGSAQEVVKSLMQSQHKAVLRDLKAGTFDDKIDRYLGGTPGLEPRPARRAARDTDISPPPPELPEMPGELDDDQVTPPAGSSLSEAVLRRAVPPDTDPPRLGPAPRVGPTVPPEPSRTGRSEVSGAFQAIVAPEEAVPSAVDDESSDTTLPRRRDPAAPEPRARRQTPSGAYSQHRLGRSDFIPEVHDQPTAPLPAPKRGRGSSGDEEHPAAAAPATSRSGSGLVPPVRPAVKPQVTGGPPPRAMGKAMPAAGATAAANAPQQPRPAVVVSRPAVIIGGPPKVVGAREQADDPRRSSRRAREEPSRPNLFGKDLISEKSLDEVILAYLSEDSSEE